MKKIISMMLVGAACLLFAGCNNQKKDKDAAVPDVKKTVEDKPVVSDGPQTYFITAPEGWIQLDTLVNGAKHTKIGSPSDGAGDSFKENINVNQEAAAGYNSKSYADANIETIKKQIAGVEIGDLGETMINGIPAECYSYSFNYQGIELKDIAWYLQKNDIGYVITCTALKSTFDKFEPKFKACANSFVIK